MLGYGFNLSRIARLLGSAATALVTWVTGATGSADFVDEALDAGWSESNGALAASWGAFEYTGEDITFAYNVGEGGDPGTASASTGKNVPRIETTVGSGDFTCDYMIAETPLKYPGSSYKGYGFVLYNPSGNSSRWDVYVNGDATGLNTFCRVGGSTLSSSYTYPDINRGFPTHIRLTRVSNIVTFYASMDGVVYDQIATSDMTSVGATVLGIYGYQIADSGHPFQPRISHVHLNGQALPTLASSVTRVPVWTPAFNDTSEITDQSLGGATLSAASGVLTMTMLDADGSYARFGAGLKGLSPDCGILMKFRVVSPTGGSLYAGIQLRAKSFQGVDWTPTYGPPLGVVAEIHGTTDFQRLITTNGSNASVSDGAYWNFIVGGNALDPDTGNWLWLRMETIGPFYRMRTWLDGNSEPETWDFEVIDASVPYTGDFGVAWAKNAGLTGGGDFQISDLEVYTFVGAEPANYSNPIPNSTGWTETAYGTWVCDGVSVGAATTLLLAQATDGITGGATYEISADISGTADVLIRAGNVTLDSNWDGSPTQFTVPVDKDNFNLYQRAEGYTIKNIIVREV